MEPEHLGQSRCREHERLPVREDPIDAAPAQPAKDAMHQIVLVGERGNLEIVREVATQLWIGMTVTDAEDLDTDFREPARELPHLVRVARR
jgi:hypothetical protein